MVVRPHRTLQGSIIKILCVQHKYNVGIVERGALVPILMEPVVEVGQEPFVVVGVAWTLGPICMELLLK